MEKKKLISDETRLIKGMIEDLKKECGESQTKLIQLEIIIDKYTRIVNELNFELEESEARKRAAIKSYIQIVSENNKNEVYSGYILKALNNCEIDQDTIELILNNLKYCFDVIDESEALEIYKKYG